MNPSTHEAESSSSKQSIATSVSFAAMALTLLGIILPACNSHTAGNTHGTNSRVIKTVTIPIEGMSCSACAARVKRALKAIDGVVEAEINLEHRNARVRYVEGKVSPERLVAAINQLGYKAGTPRIGENRVPFGPGGDSRAALIPITGMACEEMCVPKVTRALEALDGVTKVEVSLKERSAYVQYLTGEISPEKMVAVINALGFKAGSPKLEP
jgi:Cu+-exporting ATPase